MLVPDLVEKVDLVRAGEERCADRMHGRVAPPLYHPGREERIGTAFSSQECEDASYLVVKASVVIEVVKVRQIGFAPPEFHVGYLKVVVNWFYGAARSATVQGTWVFAREKDVQIQRLKSLPPSSDMNFIALPGTTYSGYMFMKSEGKRVSRWARGSEAGRNVRRADLSQRATAMGA